MQPDRGVATEIHLFQLTVLDIDGIGNAFGVLVVEALVPQRQRAEASQVQDIQARSLHARHVREWRWRFRRQDIDDRVDEHITVGEVATIQNQTYDEMARIYIDLQ